MRKRLLADRDEFVAGPSFTTAETALARHLANALAVLEPELLGLYTPRRSEFNAPAALAADPRFAALALALPFAERLPTALHYRAWDRTAPTEIDACGIPSTRGARVVPDVILLPCVGYTTEGFRLGYGGGYFDRWLAAHPGVTAVGVAWSVGRIDAGAFAAQPHDQPLALIVTELGVA